MAKIIDVSTGQVKVARGGAILRSIAIGSCVAVAAYDPKKKMGALAHIMLPESAPKKHLADRTKYAADAIEEIIRRITRLGGNSDDIEVCLVGGANVLKKKDDTICKNNIKSTIRFLEKKRIPIKAKLLGGTIRRGICLDIASGSVFYMEGDGKEKLLYRSD